MKHSRKHINKIKREFLNMKNEHDFVDLLSQVRQYLFIQQYKSTQKCIKFNFKSLLYFSDYTNKRYNSFYIKKKSGGKREIHSPVKSLKLIQRCINHILQCIYNPDDIVNGFVWNRSIINNAEKHVGKQYVFNIDLEDFFHNFNINQVRNALMIEPFNLKNGKESIATIISKLCTHKIAEGRIVLAQGSPTSPTLSNILCSGLDEDLKKLAINNNATYTRYADDITFSSSTNIFKDYNKIFDKFQHEDDLPF